MRTKLKPLYRQTMVVTGASSGIGLAIAKRAAESGARVILLARNAEALKDACEDIKREGGQADYVVADVGVREQVHNAVNTIVERHGGFDTWVNDAGVGVYGKLEELTDEDHQRLFQTNYWGVVFGSTEAMRHLRPKGGALINIGSISGDVPAPILSAYTATKHAVKGFTNSLRLETKHDKTPVSVTLIKPSGIHSPFGQHAPNYMDNQSQVPPPVYNPDLVAQAVMHAATHPVRDITVGGAGGMMIWFTRLMPSLADRVYSKLYFHTALNKKSRPRSGPDALHSPGGDGEIAGDQKAHVRQHSLYTKAQTTPWVKPALFTAGTVAATLAARKYVHNHRQKPPQDRPSTRH